MTDSQPSTIETVEQAGRFLGNIGADNGFDEAVRRVEARSNADVAGKLRQLADWVSGTADSEPDPALRFIGTAVKHMPGDIHKGTAIAAIDEAMADARALSDHVRSGVISGALYLALLLFVGASVSLVWIANVAPNFDQLYRGMSTEMPAFSQVFVDLPWLIFLLLTALAGMLGLLVISMRHVARAIGTIGPVSSGWKSLLVGRRLAFAYSRWRALTLARAWVTGGAQPTESLRQAAGILGADAARFGELEAAIELASDIGAGSGELDYLAQSGAVELRNAIEIWQAIRMRSLQVLVSVVIGMIIVAIYLPIFGLGGIV